MHVRAGLAREVRSGEVLVAAYAYQSEYCVPSTAVSSVPLFTL